jgi:hypothetical protein
VGSTGKSLSIGQDGVACLERRSDVLISTSRHSEKSMGAELNLVAEITNPKPVVLCGVARRILRRLSILAGEQLGLSGPERNACEISVMSLSHLAEVRVVERDLACASSGRVLFAPPSVCFRSWA